MNAEIIYSFEHKAKCEYRKYRENDTIKVVAFKDNVEKFYFTVTPQDQNVIDEMEKHLLIEDGLIELCKSFDSILINS